MKEENLQRRIENLRERYPLYSREDELVVRVSRWIHEAAKSLIPNSALTVAEGHIESYEKSAVRYEFDRDLAKKLWEIIEEAWNKYGKVEAIQ
jgi:hypothetical protein